MNFLYFLILCYTSTSMTPVNGYVILAANLNDLRTIAKKFAPKDVVNEIKALVLEKGNKYYRKPSKYDQQEDRIVEYEETYDDDENSYKSAEELRTALAKQLKTGYKSKKTAKVAFVEPRKHKQVTKVAGRTTDITLNEIIQKVKENLLKDFFKSGTALGYKIADKMQLVDSQDYNNVLSKYATQAKVGQKTKPVYYLVPMKVLKEEVQFEASYEDTDNKPQMQYYNHYKPIVKKSPGPNNTRNYPVIYATNTIPQTNKKKVRVVKQVLAPAHSDQGQSVHVSQSYFVHQPSLDHQSNIPQHSNLEPHLSWPQENMDQPSLLQPNIAQQLALMQQQINELAKIAQVASGLKTKTALESPHLNIEAIDAHFHIQPHQNVKVDENKTSENQGHHDEPTEDTISEETANEPVVDETSTKDLTVPGVVENEQFEEEYSVGSMENEEEITEINSNEEQLDVPMHVIKVDNNVREGSGKAHTQEFGNPNAGPPIVEKTYNFDAPKKVADDPNVHINIPVSRARKVMLF